ncbi:class I SAM-dependent methyltransferase [Mariprofundus erugo]|uniref:Class I SAM-dependent methyltransferase n=1 Tax=Mariprofundus erugo TaxID=2528639 RepID=A0A5R9GLM2_9PROT|nr:class I SAM-dependent methyltransferase [Mariprofundus erugo]TLS67331.1 class I SAM-dependent methyltransferase [Mariprofundus erugo]
MAELDHFLKTLPYDQLAREFSADNGLDAENIKERLLTYANESRVTVALIQPHLTPALRLLEVGAGLCLTSLFLKQQGYQITALEPAMGGFGLFEQLKRAILNHYSDSMLTVLEKPAQALTTADGHFDLIFSNNVIEHIPDWPAALTAMGGVLSDQGKMLHACPNYTVPYEPHYGVPVFRHLRKFSKWLFLGNRDDTEIWDSLNFITCREVAHYGKQHELSCTFEKALLYKALKRIEDDPLFETRHQGAVATIARLLMRSGIGTLFRYIPPSLATPMIVHITPKRLN